MQTVQKIFQYSGCLLPRTHPSSLGSKIIKKQTGATSLLLSPQKRHYAESKNCIQIERDGVHKEIAILRMNSKPINGMNKDFMTELNVTLEKLENDESYRGVIITSAIPGIFSGGLDITDMYQKSQDHTRALWVSLQRLFLGLYGTRLVTVAAINGHFLAGGCLMSLSCDYRILAEGKCNGGFPTVKLGLMTPYWVHDIMSRTCGERATESSFQLGTIYQADEALNMGLVDELVPREELMDVARKQMLMWLQVPDHARVMTKEMLRAPLIEKARSQQEEEIEYFTKFIQQDAVQNAIEKYLQHLKKK